MAGDALQLFNIIIIISLTMILRSLLVVVHPPSSHSLCSAPLERYNFAHFSPISSLLLASSPFLSDFFFFSFLKILMWNDVFLIWTEHLWDYVRKIYSTQNSQRREAAKKKIENEEEKKQKRNIRIERERMFSRNIFFKVSRLAKPFNHKEIYKNFFTKWERSASQWIIKLQRARARNASMKPYARISNVFFKLSVNENQWESEKLKRKYRGNMSASITHGCSVAKERARLTLIHFSSLSTAVAWLE